ncbi:hypothetical protein ACQEVB_35505 [Pseudonocardia sp. CA-107938]|uniref:hypothetical protein n=1 Tax=Pseudonocardia sp. CA-107938 TaxID=3240021 RepID=UPI003D8D6E98
MTSHGNDHGGEQGPMDRLKSAWREAVGSRDDARDEETERHDERAPLSGAAHPADVRPELSAQHASGMQPADAGAATERLPQQGTAHRIPSQQAAPQEQPVHAGAAAGHARGTGQAPPAPTDEDDLQEQDRSRPPQQPSEAVVPQQGGPAGSEQSRRSAWSEPGRRPDEETTGTPNGTPGAPTSTEPAAESSAAHSTDTDSTDTDQEPERPIDTDADPRATVRTNDSVDNMTTAGTTDSTESGGRHQSSSVDGGSTATAGAAGVTADRTERPEAAHAERDGGAAGAQDVPADPEKFVPADRAKGFAARWAEVKGEFVDEPRDAVRKADALVGDVLDEIGRVFTEHRSRLEQGLDNDGTSTEDLRQAMQRYRKFFERLLTI